MLTVIYVIGASAVGFLAGIIVEVFIDADQVRRMNAKISELETMNQSLIDGKTEVIEIVDNRTKDEPVCHDYFKPF